MSLQDAQREVDEWIGLFQEGYWHPLTLLARLTEEVGELAREVNHRFGQKHKRQDEPEQDLEEEMGDIIFVLCCLANATGSDLERGFSRTMEKLRQRDAYRFPRKDGATAPVQHRGAGDASGKGGMTGDGRDRG